MTVTQEAKKKLMFADFLISRSDGENYSKAAFNHVYSAANMLIRSLCGIDEIDSNSPQMVKQNLKKFKSSEASNFSKFYVSLLKSVGKEKITIGQVEEAMKKTQKFMRWVQNQQFSEK